MFKSYATKNEILNEFKIIPHQDFDCDYTFNHIEKYSITQIKNVDNSKSFCTQKCREVVALSRFEMGRNGILLEYEVGNHFCDAESHLFYEGAYEMDILIASK